VQYGEGDAPHAPDAMQTNGEEKPEPMDQEMEGQ